MFLHEWLLDVGAVLCFAVAFWAAAPLGRDHENHQTGSTLLT